MNLNLLLCKDFEDFSNRLKETEGIFDSDNKETRPLIEVSEFIDKNKDCFIQEKGAAILLNSFAVKIRQMAGSDPLIGKLQGYIRQLLPSDLEQAKVSLLFIRQFAKDQSECFQSIANWIEFMKIPLAHLDLSTQELAVLLPKLEYMDLTNYNFKSIDLEKFTQYLLHFNLKFKTKDLIALSAIARLCAQQNGRSTAQYIQNFQIEDPAVRADIARLCAQQNGWGTAQYIQNFQIENPAVRADIARLCAQQDGLGTAQHIQNFQIEDPAVRADIARLCAQKSGRGTAKYIEKFQIEDPAVRADIARLCARQDGEGTAAYIKNFQIKDTAVRADIARLCAQKDGEGTAAYIENFQIEDPAVQADIARLCAQQDGRGTAQYIQRFYIWDPAIRADIARLCAQQNGVGTAMYIENFQIGDPAVRADIARLCAQQNGEGTAQCIKNFQIEDLALRADIARLCAQQNGRGTAQYIERFQIKDPAIRADIARLCAQQNGEGTALYIQNFEIEDPAIRADIARLCAQQNGEGTAHCIKNFEIEDPAVRSDIARLCTQQNSEGTAEYIQNFEIEDIDILKELFMQCILSNPKNLLLINNFSPFPNELQKLYQELNKSQGKTLTEQSFLEINHVIQDLPIAETHRKTLLGASKMIQELPSHTKKTAGLWLIASILKMKAMKSEAVEWMIDQGIWSELSLLRDPNLRVQLSKDLYDLCEEADKKSWEEFISSVRGIEGQRMLILLAIPFSRLKKQGIDQKDLLEIAHYLSKCQKKNDSSFRSVYHLKNLLSSLHALTSNAAYDRQQKKAGFEKIFANRDEAQILKNIIAVKGLLQLKDSAWPTVPEDLSTCFRATLERIIPLGDYQGNASEKYEEIFGTCRNPSGLLTYAAGLKTLGEPAVMTCLGQYVVSVLEGTFQKKRYDTTHNLHLSKILETHPHSMEKWSENLSVDLESLISTETKQEAFNPSKWLETKLVTDKHLGEKTDLAYISQSLKADPEQKSQIFKRLLVQIKQLMEEEKKNQLREAILKYKNIVKDLDEKQQDEKKNAELNIVDLKKQLHELLAQVALDPHLALLNLQKTCLTFVKTGQGASKETLIHLLEEIQKVLHQKTNPETDFATTEFANDVKNLIENFKTKQKTSEGLKVVFTDDPIDLLLCGTDVPSCQRLDGDPNFNKGLLGYLMDGKNRLLAIKDGDKIVARCILSRLWDGERWVMYQERFYPDVIPANQKAALQALAKQIAKEHAMPLTCEEGETSYGKPLQALGSSVPYEYSDGAGGLQKNGRYIINNAKLIE